MTMTMMTTMSGGNVRRRRSAQQVRRTFVFSPLMAAGRRSEFFFGGSYSFKAEKVVANAEWVALNHTILWRAQFTQFTGRAPAFILYVTYTRWSVSVCSGQTTHSLGSLSLSQLFLINSSPWPASLSPLSDKTSHTCQIIISPHRIVVVSAPRDYRSYST